MIRALLLLCALSFAGEDLIGPPAEAPRDEAATAELTEALATKLRCPVCQGLSVNDSKAEAAVAMKHRIEELVAEGYSEEQIVDFFIDRYGEWVLLEPTREGINLLVWIGPVLFLGLGLGWVGWSLKNKPPSPPAPAPAGGVSGGDDPYRQRILDELGEDR